MTWALSITRSQMASAMVAGSASFSCQLLVGIWV